ncbi:EboA domain-containing protein [Streptomyces tanashiensis]|uniref:EboA domain-containing protein n=1 Tax=Streptomyces tanashiensis TaxID=67367 RepID=UPI001E39A370
MAARSVGPDPALGEATRIQLLQALPGTGAELASVLMELYDGGDTAERIAVLRALPLLDQAGRVEAHAKGLVEDALRTNDARLVAAAVGPYAARRLDQEQWRQAVLKCVFLGVPLDVVAGLARRRDPELDRMFAAFAAERIAAGRQVPADVRRQLDPDSPA